MAANEQIARDKVEYDREQDRLFEEEVRKHMESWEWRLGLRVNIIKALRDWAEYGVFEYTILSQSKHRLNVKATELMLVEEFEVDPDRLEVETEAIGDAIRPLTVLRVKIKGKAAD